MCLQVVYLLDVAAHTVQHITDSSGRAESTRLDRVCFTPDSSMIVAAFGTSAGSLLEVYCREGLMLHQIWPRQPEHPYYRMKFVCLPGDRAVTSAHCHGLTAWNLLTGLQAGAVRVHEDQLDSDEEYAVPGSPAYSSQLCTNQSASRLAYIEAESHLVYLFDGVTLQALGAFCPPEGVVPSAFGFCGLALGVYSCLLQTRSDWCTRAWHLCRLKTSTEMLQKGLQVDLVHTPALSEDDAFAACICRMPHICVQIFDVRSGVMTFSHETGLPGDDEDWGEMSLTWTGSCLLIILNNDLEDSRRCTDHIFVLQF